MPLNVRSGLRTIAARSPVSEGSGVAADGAIGQVTSVHMYVSDPLATGESAKAWRFNPDISGAGLFLDLASHYFDIVDFLAGRNHGRGGLRHQHRQIVRRPKT